MTERQKKILDAVIEQYIEKAKPVSSQLLEKEYDFGIRPASIRLEMQRLTDDGYIFQPHTSAGRVPTDKGYRFFVNEILEEGPEDFDVENLCAGDIKDIVRFLQGLTKNLAAAAEALVLGYLENKKIFWKEGWEEILREPEFEKREFRVKFANFLEELEQKILETSFFSRLLSPSRESVIGDLRINSEIRIYIGRENPVKKAEDFSVIISRWQMGREKGIVSILGPKRMNYDRNIGLMNSLCQAVKVSRLSCKRVT